MNEEQKYKPMQVLQPTWRKQTLNLFMNALWRYYEKLSEYAKPGNTQIETELKKIQRLRKHIKNYWGKGEDDFDLVTLPLEAQDYGFLLDILWKYNSAKKQELQEAQRSISVEAAHEHLNREANLIQEILQAEIWNGVERGKILTDSLYKPAEQIPQGNSPIQNQVVIGTVYGQVIGTNQGQVVQNNITNSQVTLQKLFELVSGNQELSDEIRSNAMGDIQTLQSQLMKRAPDKGILEKARNALGILADSAQVGQFAVQVAPLIKTLFDILPI